MYQAKISYTDYEEHLPVVTKLCNLQNKVPAYIKYTDVLSCRQRLYSKNPI